MGSVTTGLEVCLAEPPSILKGTRFGLLLNQASVDRHFHYAHDLLHHRFPGQLAALFTPQHGLWCAEQDNMIETGHSVEPRLGIPIHSLYSETRVPRAEMLSDLELLVVDLQDVGTRVYTYVWTLTHCLQACATAGIPVLVLDRPNPLGGETAEGPLLDPAFASFVGRAPIPMRHGLTIAELALYLNELMEIGADVHTVPMTGWQRSMVWPDSGRAWVPPSPNLPRCEGAQVYPGQVLLEGTELSEGRGTTTPFEMFGAPWLDPNTLLNALDTAHLPGLALRPVRFRPTFQKHAGQSCGGLHLHVTDPEAYRPYATTVTLLSVIHRLWPEQTLWRPPPYEYEVEKMPIDILSGSSVLREAIDAGNDGENLATSTHLEPTAWWQDVAPHLLY